MPILTSPARPQHLLYRRRGGRGAAPARTRSGRRARGPPRRPEALQVDHDALLAAARDDDDRLLRARVLLAMRSVRRDEDVVALLGLQADLLLTVREDEGGRAGDHVNRGLGLAVVVVA